MRITVELDGYLRTVVGQERLDLDDVPEGANLVQLIYGLNARYAQSPAQRLFNPRHEGYLTMSITRNGQPVGDPADAVIHLANGDTIRFTPVR